MGDQLLKLIKLCYAVAFGIVFILMTNPSQAALSTEIKTDIQLLQSQFGNSFRWPILIFDQDEIEWLFLKNKAFGEAKESLRRKLLQDYVFDKIGVSISDSEAATVEDYLHELKASAVALPFKKSILSNKLEDVKFCGVFPASMNTNERLEVERVLGLGTDIYPHEKNYEHLKHKLPLLWLQRISLYHELSHCLDQKFLPEAYLSNSSHDVHQAESFAEVMALLLLQKRFGSQNLLPVIEERAQMRLIYATHFGPYSQAHIGNGFGSPHYADGGAIYHLFPILRGLEAYLSDDHQHVSNKEVTDLVLVAESIVEEYKIPYRAFRAMVLFYKSPEKTVKEYERLAQQSPDFFKEAYEYLLEFQDLFREAQENGFFKEKDNLISLAFSEDQESKKIVLEDLCSFLRAGDKEAFIDQILVYRQELKMDSQTELRSKERQKLLDDIFNRVQTYCERPFL